MDNEKVIQQEYLHNFLLQAKQAGCNVDNYIIDEINKLIEELKVTA